MKRLKYNYKPKFYNGGNLTQEQIDNRENQQAQGAGMYGSAMKGVAAVPVVGTAISGLAGIGDAIGKPLKSNAEKMNADGTLKNRNASTLGHTAGALFNPAATLSRTMNDKSASTGQKWAAALTGGVSDVFFAKKYNNNLENVAQSQQAIDEANALAEQQAAEEADRKYKEEQQNLINQAYYSANSASGNAGASIYAAYGGSLPKFPDGGKMAIITNDPNDPRLRAYNDSLYIHNRSKIDLNAALNGKDISRNQNDDIRYGEARGNLEEMNGTPPRMIGPWKHVKSRKNNNTDYYMGTYKKPTDEVIYIPKYNKKPKFAVEDKPNKEETRKTVVIEDKPKEIKVKSNIIDPMKQVGYNGMLAPIVEQYAGGGELNPLASDVVKAEGATHEQGGIDLQANGRAYAEVEDQEIIHGNRVFSDRLELDGKTYADRAEKLGKEKGRYEKLSTGNFREQNSAERGMNNVDKKLDMLFQTQEANKPIQVKPQTFAWGGTTDEEDEDLSQGFKNELGKREYNNAIGNYNMYSPSDQAALRGETPMSNPSLDEGSNGVGNKVNWAGMAQMAVPFLDNIYNASLIKKTPAVPVPNKRVAYDVAPTYMKTKYNVDNQLADVNDYYRNFTENIDANSSSSNIARGNKMAAFASTIKARNNIFADKENKETSLINQNNQNIQNVNSGNIRNRQEIDNTNFAIDDRYRNDVAGRSNQMLKDKSANFANAVDDAGMLIRDNNMKKTDEERIMTDSLRYNDASGYARLVGTSTMDGMIKSNPQYRDQIENSLEKGNQTKALAEFRKKYPKKK